MENAETVSSIFSFQDHKEFIRSYYEIQKAENPNINWKGFADKLGISQALLKMLLNGKRKFTVEHIHAFAKHLVLTPLEYDYFEALVLKNQASEPRIRAYYDRRIRAMMPCEQSEAMRLDPRLLDQNWFIPGLIVCLALRSSDNESLDPQIMSEELNIPVDVIERTIEQLERLGVIAITAEKRIILTLTNLSASLSQRRLVRKISEESLKRIQTDFDSKRAFFDASAFTITPSELHQLTQEIKNLLRQYSTKTDSDAKNKQEVYQSVIHFWPFRK
ncbi:MAG: TIGR02147 family protein [Pseudobacteriovorax sp.]|nr:TIGR02147 family protein [Pseudobacteriovorax sp.]